MLLQLRKGMVTKMQKAEDCSPAFKAISETWN